jgi:DNA-binding CsgD family transcriptional regulator
VEILWRLGDRWHLRFPLNALADLAATLEPPAAAARLLGAVFTVREVFAHPLEPRYKPSNDAAVASVRAALGEKAFAMAWAEGQEWSLEQAVAAAARVGAGSSGTLTAETDPGVTGDAHHLTPREQEVLRLVAQGHSNREIAEALCISVPTVKRHLSTVLGKLALPSRAAATAYAHTHDLV